MRLPSGWGIASISMRLYDESANDLEIEATNDCANEPYIAMKTSALGVGLGRGDLYRLADIAEELLTMYEDAISEAPDAGSSPATGITQHAETERTV